MTKTIKETKVNVTNQKVDISKKCKLGKTVYNFIERNNVLNGKSKDNKILISSLDINKKTQYNKVMKNFKNKFTSEIKKITSDTNQVERILELSFYTNDVFNMLTSNKKSTNEIGKIITNEIAPILLEVGVISKSDEAQKISRCLRNIAINSEEFIKLIENRLKKNLNVNWKIRTCEKELRNFIKGDTGTTEERSPQMTKEKSKDEKIEAQAKSLNKLIEKDGIDVFAQAIAIKFNSMTNVEKCTFYRIFTKNINGNFDDFGTSITPVKVPKTTSQSSKVALKTV